MNSKIARSAKPQVSAITESLAQQVADLKARNAELVKVLTNAAAALRYCQVSLPVDDPLKRKVEVTEAACREALAKAQS